MSNELVSSLVKATQALANTLAKMRSNSDCDRSGDDAIALNDLAEKVLPLLEIIINLQGETIEGVQLRAEKIELLLAIAESRRNDQDRLK